MQSIDNDPGRGVSVVVPCLNEAAHIEAFLRNALSQEPIDDLEYEFLIVDGGSEDGTREITEKMSKLDQRIRPLDNVDRTASAGLNKGIRSARYDIVVRMDVHTEYAPDYVRKCVEVLERTGAENVGGPARTKAKGYIQQAVRLAYHSWFSVGGALFHYENHEGYVETVTYGCWKKKTLHKFNLFDEEFARNEDDELNLRIIRGGGKIWQCPQIRSWYYPRDSIALLFKQYLQYGYWKVRIIKKHKLPASYRHLVPACFVLALLGLSLLAPFDKVFALGLAGVLGAYSCANLSASLITCRKQENCRFLPIMPAVFATYHFAYGWGFLMGLMDFIVLRRSARSPLLELTRRRVMLKYNPESKLSHNLDSSHFASTLMQEKHSPTSKN
ncbi:MAG: glycosyltransferase family 2 protein [Desulfomonile tiedjei]|uniref:Glycosyltransferase family 2 protein n=1 Tax=Desulfomonile tiedjei TaxID=2358 RepID=A0A9D6V379_9BACT|nr:glycosyltransferase family 2 protein [Desulfomonile tiedjei]